MCLSPAGCAWAGGRGRAVGGLPQCATRFVHAQVSCSRPIGLVLCACASQLCASRDWCYGIGEDVHSTADTARLCCQRVVRLLSVLLYQRIRSAQASHPVVLLGSPDDDPIGSVAPAAALIGGDGLSTVAAAASAPGTPVDLVAAETPGWRRLGGSRGGGGFWYGGDPRFGRQPRVPRPRRHGGGGSGGSCDGPIICHPPPFHRRGGGGGVRGEPWAISLFTLL